MTTTELIDPATDPVGEYVRKLSRHAPGEALEIALAEADKYRAKAELQNAEYRAMAEVEFAPDGSIGRANMAGLYRLAAGYSRSQIVPEHYRGKPDDCFIACQMSMRLKVDPLAYMQNSYVVHGKPGIEAKLSIALLNQSGKIKGRITYTDEGSGDSRKCTASAVDADTGEVVSATVTMKMVKDEGWYAKKGSKWQTMPDIMFHYRSATFLVRQFFPEVTMGMPTVQELYDVMPDEPEPVPPTKGLDDLTKKLVGKGSDVHKEADRFYREPVTDAVEGVDTEPEPNTDGTDEPAPETEDWEDIEGDAIDQSMREAHLQGGDKAKSAINTIANTAFDAHPDHKKFIAQMRNYYLTEARKIE